MSFVVGVFYEREGGKSAGIKAQILMMWRQRNLVLGQVSYLNDSLLSGYIFSFMNCRFKFLPHFVDLSSLFVKRSFGK